ncbi:MAG: YdcF family protein [Nevskia sp.]|nr:YdcF family protein [Nevskia sp.]
MKFGRHHGRRLRRWLLAIAVAALGLVALINNWVVNNTYSYIYDDWSLLPDNDVGLVLGTSPRTRGGEPNPQFYGRIHAAAQLYQLGKIKRIIVSGANPDSTYNEPRAMRRELVKSGVPPAAIYMDYAGFRTFDSVARAQVVFGLNKVTIVTQRYHAYRAVFVAKKLHLQVAAYAAPSDEIGPFTRTMLREVLARVRVVLDIYVLHTAPKFLGAPQPVDTDKDASPPPDTDG